MKRTTTILLASLITLSTASAAPTIVIPSKSNLSHRTSISTEDIVPLPWPSEPRTPGNAQSYTREFDGFTELLFRFSLPNFECNVEPFGVWKNFPLNSRYSILLKNSDSSVKFGISHFKEGEFLSSLEHKEWIRYIEFLKISNPNLTITFESSNFESQDGLYVLGKKYREVIYEITEPKKKPISVQEIFAFVNDKLVVFTIRGTKDDIARKKGATHAMICRMDFPEIEEESDS